MRALCIRHLCILLLSASVIAVGSARDVSADVPGMISYQGKLTDDGGKPVPDDTYEIQFCLYEDSTGGVSMWCEKEKVEVVEGLFSVLLGSGDAIEPWMTAFGSMYLGISVSGEAEMTPRTRMVTTPFSFVSQVADSVKGEPYLNEAGDTLRGSLLFESALGSAGAIRITANAANLFLQTEGVTRSKLYGESYGTLNLYDADGDLAAKLDAHFSAGGDLALYDSTGVTTHKLYSEVEGDAGTILPDNAVNSDEILDEPGVAYNHGTNVVLNDGTVMQEMVAVSMVTPGPGYVYVIGRFYISFLNVDGPVGVAAQIDTLEGGVADGSYYTRMLHSDPVAVGDIRMPVVVDRMFYAGTSGSHEFLMEAKSYGAANCSSLNTYAISLVALYFPTSYGAVKSLVTAPGDNPEAVPSSITDEDGDSQNLYEVDLRYYELRAKEAKARALEAELELREARDRSERISE